MQRFWQKSVLPTALFCLICGLVIALWQSPCNTAPRTTLYFDSGHYLDSCQVLAKTVKQWHDEDFSKAAAQELANWLMLDGPVLPIAGALAFQVAGQVPQSGHWFTLVAMQCFFQAVAAALLCLITIRLSKSRIAGLFAGLIWSFCPSAVSATNSFLTEPLSVTLFLSVIALLYGLVAQNGNTTEPVTTELPARSRNAWTKPLLAIAAGFTTGTLMLLKPALLPTLILIHSIALFNCRQKLSAASTLFSSLYKYKQSFSAAFLIALGLSLCLIPWLLFTKYATGSFHLLPSRRPVYNIVSGMNIETDGWGTHPNHPVIELFSEDEQAAAVGNGLWQTHGPELTNLFLRKPMRLWSLPWNDYRHKIFGLSYGTQSLLHAILILFGLYGAIFWGAKLLSSTLDSSQKFLIASCITGILGHLIYLPFESISRYAFTAIPLLTILAVSFISSMGKGPIKLGSLLLAAGINLLAVVALRLDLLPFLALAIPSTSACIAVDGLLKASLIMASFWSTWQMIKNVFASETTTARRALAFLFLIMAAYFSMTVFAFSSSEAEAHEWSCVLKNDQAAVRKVDVETNNSVKPDWALVLIDGDNSVANALLTVNGKVLTGKPVSIYQLYGKKYDIHDTLNIIGLLLRKNPEDIPRWRVCVVPIELLNLHGSNTIKASIGSGDHITIYGDYQREGRERSRCIPVYEEISPGKMFNGSEDRFESRVLRPTGSLLGRSVSFLLSNDKENKKDLSGKLGTQTGDYRIFLMLGYGHSKSDSSQPTQQPTSSPELILPKSSVSPAQLNITIPDKFLNASLLQVKVDIDVRTRNSAGQIAISGIVTTENRTGFDSVLPGSPKVINVNEQWQTAEFLSSIPTSRIRSQKPKLHIEFNRLGGAILCQNLKVSLIPKHGPEFAHHSIKIF